MNRSPYPSDLNEAEWAIIGIDSVWRASNVPQPLKSLDVSLVLLVKSTLKQETLESRQLVDFQPLWHYFSSIPKQFLLVPSEENNKIL